MLVYQRVDQFETRLHSWIIHFGEGWRAKSSFTEVEGTPEGWQSHGSGKWMKIKIFWKVSTLEGIPFHPFHSFASSFHFYDLLWLLEGYLNTLQWPCYAMAHPELSQEPKKPISLWSKETSEWISDTTDLQRILWGPGPHLPPKNRSKGPKICGKLLKGHPRSQDTKQSWKYSPTTLTDIENIPKSSQIATDSP